MKRIVYLLSLLIAVFTFKSCSTDFDVIGEYEETTIVYGMLDQSESLHFIKINKSFLGPGNAFDYAAIRDSSEYENVDGKVEEWKDGVMTGREWILLDTVLTDREDGTFYGPEQTMYYFNEPLLDTGAEYRLVLDINEGQKEVTASTELIRSFTISQPSSSPSAQVSFLSTYPPANNTSYNDFNIKWRNGTYGKRYDLTIRFKYDEVTASGTQRKYIDWFLGSEYVADEYLNRGGLIEFVKVANGFAFYSFIAAKLQTDPNVLKRVFRSIDIMVTSASEELNTYMVVNAPSNGLIQEKPQFTNISNGVGLFSARYNVKRGNKFLSKNSLHELCEGAVTGHLGFCSDSTAWALETFYCP
jgi:hypothetical protein